ncbi:MAG: hypothetical protein PHX61_07710 [Alphaproteobacteria bacterium]|nr:hypothetical protein [Alphaproteobacteria bacterium]
MAVYDLAMGGTTRLEMFADADSWPRVSGERIVWSAKRDKEETETVYMYSFNSQRGRAVAQGEDPDISGDRIVYTAHGGEDSQVRVHDIRNGTDDLLPLRGDLSGARIDGSDVIVGDSCTRMGYIQLYNLSTGKMTVATNDGSYDEATEEDVGCDTGLHYDLEGGRIAYYKSSNDILGRPGSGCMTSPAEIVRSSTRRSSTPDISGVYVVFGRTIAAGEAREPAVPSEASVSDLSVGECLFGGVCGLLNRVTGLIP